MSTRTAKDYAPDGLSLWGCCFIVLLMFLPFVIFTASATPQELLRFFPDDAFYYLQTAANFASHGAITFDGINETNGFHPLYFIVVSILARIFGKSNLLYAAFAVHALCIFLSAILIVRSTKALPLWLSAGLLTFLCAPSLWVYVWLSAGMESGLVLLATALVFAALKKCFESDFASELQCAGFGSALAMLLLARLDMIICAAPLIACIGLRFMRVVYGRQGSLQAARPYLLALGIPLFSCGAFMIVSFMTFGHIMPVSAVVKNIFFFPFRMSWDACTSGGNPIIASILLLPLALALLVLCRFLIGLRRCQWQASFLSLVLLGAGVVLYYLYLFFFASNFFRWYFTFPLAFAAIALTCILHAFTDKLQRLRPTVTMEYSVIVATVAAGIIFTAIFFEGRNRPQSVQQCLYEVARQIDARLDKESVVGTYDAGTVGFFSGRRVVNLDGLANNYDYLFSYLVPRHFYEYFKKQGISHFLIRDCLIKNLAEVRSGSYAAAQFIHDSRVILKKEDEVFRYDIPGNFLVICYRLSY